MALENLMATFRQWWKRFWTNTSAKTEPAPLPPPGPEVSTVRFIFNKNHFNSKEVKAGALMPRVNEETGRWETSIIRIDGIAEPEIWQIGAEVVEPYQGRPAKAWGEATVAEIRSVALDVDVTPEPHPRHLDLIGWPLDESPEAQRSRQQSVAADLALKSRLHKRRAL